MTLYFRNNHYSCDTTFQCGSWCPRVP